MSFLDDRLSPEYIMKLYRIVLVLISVTAVGITSWADNTAIVQTEASAGTAKIEGIVKDQLPPRAPVPNAVVKLFPDPPSAEHPELIRTTRTDDWGNFAFEHVFPGKYRIVAIMGTGAEDLQAEVTIAAAAGTRVDLSENKSKTLTLYLYPGH